MKTYRIKAIIFRHLYEARHNVDRIVDMVYWPVLDIIFFGFFTIYLARSSQLEPNLITFLLGAVIIWGTFYAFQRDLSLGFLDEIWSRNILNLFSTPLIVSEYLIGLVLINLSKIAIGFSVAALVAWVFYSFSVTQFSFLFLPFFMNLLLFSLPIGIVITGLILRYNTKIQTLTWSFAGLLQPISAVFYPLSTLPGALQAIAWFLPTTHVFEGMRQILSGGGFSTTHFWWGLILNIFYFGIALAFFKKIFEVAKKRGLLVKLE